MSKKFILFSFFVAVSILPVFAELRSFDGIFPHLPPEIHAAVFSEEGYIKSSEKSSGFVLVDRPLLDPRIRSAVLDRSPGFLVETLLVAPSAPLSVTLLDVYNALGNIRGLKGRVYRSQSRNKEVPLFEEAVRLESEKKAVPVPDPGPASDVPRNETVYIRVKDVNFGNSYYRGDMTLDQYGIRYCLSNNKSLTYLFIPVIKEENFSAQLYFEPIEEGVLIYGIAGTDVSNFVSSSVDIPSAISKRLAVIISWVVEGIGKTGKSGG
jgi:hypothetical protein